MGYPRRVVEVALYLLQQGYTPKETSLIIQKKLGVFVPPNTISKWKQRYLKRAVQKPKNIGLEVPDLKV